MTLTIPADDHGQIRIFSVPAPMPDGLEDKTPQALLAAFGTDTMDPKYIDVIDAQALSGLTLVDYLRQGYDLDADSADSAALSGLTGTVVMIMSRATAGADTTLTLAAGVRLVTTVSDKTHMTIPASMVSTSAEDIAPVGKAPSSNAAMSGRVATIALLVLFAIVGLMVWVAS